MKGGQEIKHAPRYKKDKQNNASNILSKFKIQGIANPKKQQLILITANGYTILLDGILTTGTNINPIKLLIRGYSY